MKICWEFTGKSAKNMRSWLITFNVILGIHDVKTKSYYPSNVSIKSEKNQKKLFTSVCRLQTQRASKQRASKSRIYERTSKTRNIHQTLGECWATLCNTAPAFSSSRVCRASQKYSRKHEANVALILWQRFKRWTNIINFLWFLTMLTDFSLLRAGTDDSVLSVVARNSGVHSFFYGE